MTQFGKAEIGKKDGELLTKNKWLRRNGWKYRQLDDK